MHHEDHDYVMPEASADPEIMKEYAQGYWRHKATFAIDYDGEQAYENYEAAQLVNELLGDRKTAGRMAALLWDSCPSDDDSYAFLLYEMKLFLAGQFPRDVYQGFLERAARRPWSPNSLAQQQWEDFCVEADAHEKQILRASLNSREKKRADRRAKKKAKR